MIDYTQGAGVQYHIGVCEEDIGKYVFLTGDPGRVQEVAKYLQNARFVQRNREFVTYTGFIDETKVSVVSTGIGGPSTAIAVEDHSLQSAYFFTPGNMWWYGFGCPGWRSMYCKWFMRAEGTSKEYAPIEFPAVPDFSVLQAQVQSAQKLSLRFHVGVAHCKDSFYGQHEPQKSPVGQRLIENWQAYCDLGTICSEMESSTLFIVSQAKHVRAGAMFMAIANQERAKQGLSNPQDHDLHPMFSCAVETMRTLIAHDKKREV